MKRLFMTIEMEAVKMGQKIKIMEIGNNAANTGGYATDGVDVFVYL